MPAKVEGAKSTRILKTAIKNKTTGRFAGYSEVVVATDTHSISVDDIPSVDQEGNPVELSKTPPPRMAGITADQLARGAKKGTSWIEESQPTGDKD